MLGQTWLVIVNAISMQERFPQILAWTVQSYTDALDLKLKSKMTLFWHNHFFVSDKISGL
jgi:uncharacterized protein (DUF1800 family)